MRGKHNNTTSTQPACASLLLIQVPQHLVQQKGDQLAYLKKEESTLREETKVIFIDDEKEDRLSGAGPY